MNKLLMDINMNRDVEVQRYNNADGVREYTLVIREPNTEIRVYLNATQLKNLRNQTAL